MEIGGYDICINTNKSKKESMFVVIDVFIKKWTNAIIEFSDPFNAIELFIYPDIKELNKEFSEKMVYVIIQEKLITIVIDNEEDEKINEIVKTIKENIWILLIELTATWEVF